MADEFDHLIEETPPEPKTSGSPTFSEPLDSAPVQEPERSALADAEPLPPLMKASDLLDPADEDMGDFEPGGLYRGFRMIPEHLWPADEWTPRHQARFPQRFYVESPSGTPGLVPWPGSQIVWPWERAWSVDLHREQVESFLKPDEEKKGKKR